MNTTRRGRLRWIAPILAVALAAVACSSSGEPRHDGDLVVQLPGAERPTDFDDLTYATRIGRLLVPARDAGLYLADPVSGDTTRFDDLGSVDSAIEAGDVIVIVNRDRRRIAAIEPTTGRLLATAHTRSAPDYVRYVARVDEIWVTEKGDDAGIEIFTREPNALRATAFIAIPEEPEGLTIADEEGRAYSHAADGNLVVIDITRRHVTKHYPTGCSGIHGIPAVDQRRGRVLAGCADDGRGVLLDTNSGRRVAEHEVGGGEALMAHAPYGHFYLRSDPGTIIATLATDVDDTLRVVRRARAPRTGHCLTADDSGHYWTCDAERATVIRYADR